MTVSIITGDCRRVLPTLPVRSIHCCVTSPPYWGLRDYDHPDQLGLESALDEYVANLVGVFHEVRRVLRDDGTLWVNLGDSYAGAGFGGGVAKQGINRLFKRHAGIDRRGARPLCDLKPKDLVGVPWRVAFALQTDGWWLRSDIIWAKSNPLPESVADRPNKAHEYVFLLTKSERYYYDGDAIREPHQDRAGGPDRFGARGQRSAGRKQDAHGLARGRQVSKVPPVEGYNPLGRNARTVWTIAAQRYPDAHFATFPSELAQRCVMAGCPEGGSVLDPFGGSGTVGEVCEALGRRSVLIELNPEYVELAKRRTRQQGLFVRAEGEE